MIPLWVVQKLEQAIASGMDGSVNVHIAQGRVQKIETTEWTREQKKETTKVLVA